MREVSDIESEWLTELAPHFYVDKRKQILEEKHRQEALRNLEHDWNKNKKEDAISNISKDDIKKYVFKNFKYSINEENSISGQIKKQNNRFRKGMNFSIMDQQITEVSEQKAIKFSEEQYAKNEDQDQNSNIYSKSEVQLETQKINSAFGRFKRQKVNDTKEVQVVSNKQLKIKKSKTNIGLSFQDEDY